MVFFITKGTFRGLEKKGRSKKTGNRCTDNLTCFRFKNRCKQTVKLKIFLYTYKFYSKLF